VTRYTCIDDQKAAGPTDRQLAEAELVALMREIFDATDEAYGAPRMTTELRRAGIIVNKKKVHRLMRRHAMAGRYYRSACRRRSPAPEGYDRTPSIRCASGGAPPCERAVHAKVGRRGRRPQRSASTAVTRAVQHRPVPPATSPSL